MKIDILEFIEGARQAEGVVVIIDVFRAFSVACYAFDSGASQYIAVGEIEKAFDLRKKFKQAILVGERDEKKIIGFDFGNSPTEIIKADLQGATVIHCTTAGTNGLVNADKASTLLTGSLVNAGAIVNYIRMLKPDHVSLVAMGYRAKTSADEDLLCARLIAERLSGNEPDITSQLAELRTGAGSRFFNSENIDFSPPTDFFLCTIVDKFNFVLKAEKRIDGLISLIKTEF